VLAELDANSLLASKGFREGDIITGINQQPVNGLVDLQDLVQAHPGPMLLQVHRNGEDYVVRMD
jgi:S1-C subfamily serine protease